ncbi:pentapeptide repeat-containing protein [Prauserella oleivorans]|uniref:Pentapeptide repeat-containing protein n=1 Tax=Prauserella oleivorans TaxID=1478153 RepID=A0ABW5WI63_9PSEU
MDRFTVRRLRSSIGMSVFGWLVLGVAVAGGTAAGLLALLGWPRIPAAGEFGVAQTLELLKIALAVVAGFGGVVLLAVNLRRQRVAEAEHDLAVERGEREQVQSFNERFGTAAEQLAHESPAVRIAGVYAMAGLADDWLAKRQVCVDVLCGYLRLGSAEPDPGEVEVRDTVLRIVRERMRTGGHWRQVALDFTGVRFVDADFSGMVFGGDVTFDGAVFEGERTSFDHARFHGTLSCHGTSFDSRLTTFTSARFLGTGVEFVGTRFGGEVVDFRDAELRGRSVDFYRVAFGKQKLDFSAVTVRSGVLRFESCEFSDVELSFELLNDLLAFHDGASPHGRVSIEDSRFTDGSFDLRHVVSPEPGPLWLLHTRFENVEFRLPGEPPAGRIHVRGLELVGCDLPGAYTRELSSRSTGAPADRDDQAPA